MANGGSKNETSKTTTSRNWWTINHERNKEKISSGIDRNLSLTEVELIKNMTVIIWMTRSSFKTNSPLRAAIRQDA